MRVLITNNRLAQRTGTELYVRDVALALKRRGHHPIAYSSDLGETADELRRADITVTDDLAKLEIVPDVIHAHHHLDAMAAFLRFPRVPALLFCHGTLPWAEKPISFPSICRHVAVDTACRDRIIGAGVEASKIVILPTFVDMKRFKLRDRINTTPQSALIFSNYPQTEKRVKLIRAACAKVGIRQVAGIGEAQNKAVATPEDFLSEYDVVFAKGRCAHEAAAAGAAVIVSDYGRFAGLLTSKVYDEWRPLNFGVRTLTRPLETRSLVDELRHYDSDDVLKVSKRIRRDACMETAVDNMVGLYREVQTERPRLAALSESEILSATTEYLALLRDYLNEEPKAASRPRLPNWLLRLANIMFPRR